MSYSCRSCQVAPFASPKARASHERKHATTTLERLYSRVDMNGGTPAHAPELGQCWVWTGHTVDGYGRMVVDGLARGTHRISLSLALGRPLGDGMDAAHRCDNPPCIRPSHLFEATDAANIRDRHEKGRDAVGSDNGRSRLTADQVREIRHDLALGESWAATARRFGIGKGTVQAIAAGRTWQHVS